MLPLLVFVFCGELINWRIDLIPMPKIDERIVMKYLVVALMLVCLSGCDTKTYWDVCPNCSYRTIGKKYCFWMVIN